VLIRAYLDATDSNQSLSELKSKLEAFAHRKGHRVGIFYNDQEPPAPRSSLFRLLRSKGLAIASQRRPPTQSPRQSTEELFLLLGQARPTDVLLIENVRLLSRLSPDDWQLFRQKTKERKVRIVSLDVKASWGMITSESAMAPTAEKLTNMMLDMLEALALKERRESRNRHIEGIAKAKAKGKYKGRPVDQKKHEKILALLENGYSWSEVCSKTGASRSTVARVVKLNS
jgi:DNA invertase Pin-like site-specific DNA recombinase